MDHAEKNLLELLTQYHDAQHQATASTMLNYCNRMRVITRWLTAQKEGTPAVLGDLNQASVRRYLAKQNAEHPQSALTYRWALRHFEKWLIMEGLLDEESDWTAKAAKPRVKKGQREPISDEDTRRLLEACDRLPDTATVAPWRKRRWRS